MKKYIFAALALVCALACSPKKEEAPKVMARAVPERADDFVFENDLIAGRFYGKALEGNPTSPGLDIWVKMPGQLVANDWYEHAVNEDPDYYHHNHGGKDCYKVAVSLGGGASAPILNGELIYPATNYRSYEMLEETPTRVRFALDHALIISAVRSGEPFRYRFGSCWSKGDIKTAEEWFVLVDTEP